MTEPVDLFNIIKGDHPEADEVELQELWRKAMQRESVWGGGDAANERPAAPSLVSLGDVEPQPPRYFWDPYIRAGNLNVVRGDGGAGKTMFLFAVAAAVTTGVQPAGMPGTLRCGQGSVIYYGAEDDAGEYAHRAALCGCDRRFLHVVADGVTLPRLADIDVFRNHVVQTGARLLIFDPIQSFLGAATDMNRANEVRPLLDGLRAMCRDAGVTVVIVEHLNKATQQKAAYRGIGTVDIINASRSTLMVGYHPTEQGASVCMHIKANARYGEPIKFEIDGGGCFHWRGSCDVTEDEVANARRFKRADNGAVQVDPVLSLVLALLEKHPEGWTGTASQMLAEGSALVDCSLITATNAIGKRLPGIHPELVRRGIVWKRSKRTHSFTRLKAPLWKSASTADGEVQQMSVETVGTDGTVKIASAPPES